MMNMMDLIPKINDFSRTFMGDPEKRLQDFVKQNHVPQEALDYAQQQANSIYQIMKGIKGH